MRGGDLEADLNLHMFTQKCDGTQGSASRGSFTRLAPDVDVDVVHSETKKVPFVSLQQLHPIPFFLSRPTSELPEPSLMSGGVGWGGWAVLGCRAASGCADNFDASESLKLCLMCPMAPQPSAVEQWDICESHSLYLLYSCYPN